MYNFQGRLRGNRMLATLAAAYAEERLRVSEFEHCNHAMSTICRCEIALKLTQSNINPCEHENTHIPLFNWVGMRQAIENQSQRVRAFTSIYSIVSSTHPTQKQHVSQMKVVKSQHI